MSDDGQAIDVSNQPDGILRWLVHGVNEAHGELSLSLLVGGNWISGMLVSPRRWMKEYSDALPKYGSGDVSGLQGALDVLGSGLFPSDSEREAFEKEEGKPHPSAARSDDLPWFAHMRDAQVFAGNEPVPAEPTFVRVRLSQVAAWSFGLMRVRS